jgi:hypothetical protein
MDREAWGAEIVTVYRELLTHGPNCKNHLKSITTNQKTPYHHSISMSTVHTTGKQVSNHLSVSCEERIVMATTMSGHMQLSTSTGTGHSAG